jgi:hypothetical protein
MRLCVVAARLYVSQVHKFGIDRNVRDIEIIYENRTQYA